MGIVLTQQDLYVNLRRKGAVVQGRIAMIGPIKQAP